MQPFQAYLSQQLDTLLLTLELRDGATATVHKALADGAVTKVGAGRSTRYHLKPDD